MGKFALRGLAQSNGCAISSAGIHISRISSSPAAFAAPRAPSLPTGLIRLLDPDAIA